MGSERLFAAKPIQERSFRIAALAHIARLEFRGFTVLVGIIENALAVSDDQVTVLRPRDAVKLVTQMLQC